MTSSYRRERYTSSRAKTKEGWLRVTFTVIILIGCFVVIAMQWKKLIASNDLLIKKSEIITKFEDELDILRTLNPYRVESNEVIAHAVQNIDIFPGWVARVYPIPKNSQSALSMNDLGSFVMNETRFSLASHKRYGMPQPSQGMYRLNGLFPSHKQGRLQVGVELYLTNQKGIEQNESSSQICSCYVRIDINKKRVIDKKIHFVTRFEAEKVITGEVELTKGLFPISAVLYCDENSDFTGDEVQVSISFRNPDQYKLTTNRDAIFHIYKPNDLTAKL